jgi:hypothetical protein
VAEADPSSEPGSTRSKASWDVEAQYPVPVGPDMAVDGAMAGINFAVRAWRWTTGHVRRWLKRGS